MSKKPLTAKASILIQASSAKLWEALTEPELIKQYLFGTQVTSDWKVGGSITYRGIWQGKYYEDKGKILRLVPEKIFQSTSWSSIGGLDDKPENYATITYELEAKGSGTLVKVSEDNIDTEEERSYLEKNWVMFLERLKKLLEK